MKKTERAGIGMDGTYEIKAFAFGKFWNKKDINKNEHFVTKKFRSLLFLGDGCMMSPMKKETKGKEIKDNIIQAGLSDALSERYLSYALSTIVSRSLPDVRDGLKPVHRRLLYAMRQLKLDPKSGFKKCARVVGDVIGKYHPHGDTSVYDAMVRLAQDFAVRYPLVEGQGNFGNIDGDGAAAMRYTEARMTQAAVLLMEGLESDAVDFMPTYDGSEDEPVLMPAVFPNLLANGSSGIAVGMATNIPPHNLAEVCEALQELIKNPEMTTKDALKYIKGPDFPTGGLLIESKESLRNTYETGRGGMRLRAKWDKEEMSHGQYQIVITEIPYQVQKSELVKKIADLILEKKLPFLTDIRDESAEDIRVVLEPKNRTIEAEVLMEQLFKLTDLETRFNLNMNVLDADGTPKVMALIDILKAFLSHRYIVLMRTSKFRLGEIERRMEILDGFLIAYLNLDEVIRIIRNEDEPKPILMKKFGLTDLQAESILNMRLRSLRKLEEMEIKKEHAALKREAADLKKIIADKAYALEKISSELAAIEKAFAKTTVLGKRRTQLGKASEAVDVPIEAFIEKEPVTILLSEKGWIRAVKGHQETEKEDYKFKDGDMLQIALKAMTTDKIVFFGSNGRAYALSGDKPQRGRGFGEPLRLLIDLPEDADVIAMFVYEPEKQYMLASTSGHGFIVPSEELVSQTKNGKGIFNLTEGHKVIACLPLEDGDSVAVVGSNRKLLIYPLKETPVLQKGKGVYLQRYGSEEVTLSDIQVFNAKEGFAYTYGGGVRIEKDLLPYQGRRAGQGRLVPLGFPRSNRFLG